MKQIRFKEADSSLKSKSLFSQVKEGHTIHTLMTIKRSPSSINSLDQVNKTALHWSAHRGDQVITEMLLQHGAEIHHKDILGRTAKDLAEEKGFSAIVKMIE